MDKLLQYIEEHIQDKITVTDMANVQGYSEYHFIRIFKSNMNEKPMEYVCKRKLIRASKDIIDGTKIIDVALKYGWDTHSGFTKAFHREFNISPSLLKAIVIVKLGGYTMEVKTKEELYKALKEKILDNGLIEKDRKADNKCREINSINIDEIYQCACNVYDGIKRYSGEEYITHTLNVAIILADMGADIEVVLAGLFCDVASKGIATLEDLKHLPKEIYDLITQIQLTSDDWTALPENVLLIKLAERLHNMRTIEYMDEARISKKAEETLQLLKPLANRIENKEILEELNALGVRYLE